jgi:hypothetical protein
MSPWIIKSEEIFDSRYKQHCVAVNSQGAEFRFLRQARRNSLSKVEVFRSAWPAGVSPTQHSPWSNGILGGGIMSVANMIDMKTADEGLISSIRFEGEGERVSNVIQ